MKNCYEIGNPMKLIIRDDYADMCAAVGEHIIEYVNAKPDSLVELPGGDTPMGIFDYLVEAAEEGRFDVSHVSFVSLDEWENLGYEVKGSCRQTLFDNLFKRLPIDIERQVCFFDGTADLSEECKRIDRFVFDHGGIDIAVLGIGMNGHIGFNEPGVDPDQYCTIVPLDEVTKSVSVKYFGGEQLNVAHGITLGMKHFMDAQEVVLIADSERKAPIVKKVVEGPMTNEVPATLMQAATQCLFYMDKAAASLLSTAE